MSLAHIDTPGGLARPGTFTEGEIETLKRTIAHDLTDDELNLFAAVCKRTGLDPFAKQIYAIKRTTRRKQRGQWVDEDVLTIQTGIDGIRLIAERSSLYAGQDPPEWCGPDGQWTDVWLSDQPPAAARVAVYRKDFARPVVGVAKFDSYADRWKPNDAQEKAGQLGDLRNLWKAMPEQMIAKCAEALALRKAFPNDLSGVYATEEMDQANNVRPIDTGAREGISERDFDEIREAAGALTDEQRGELHAWCEAEGIEVARARLTSDGAGRVLQRILDLARGAMDVPSGPATSAPSSPVVSDEAAASMSDGGTGGEAIARTAPSGAATPENPTQGGGDDDSAGKGSPGAHVAAATPGQSSSEAEPEPTPARRGAGEAAASSAPSGAVTPDQLRRAVAAAHPDRDTARKQEITAAKVAASVAGALSLQFAGGFDDIVADQQLAAAVLADLRGDDKPPPPGGSGSAVGEQAAPEAPASGPAPTAPAPTAEPVPYSEADPKGYQALNRYCRGVQGRRFDEDDSRDRKNQPQWDALVWAATGGTETELKKATREQAVVFQRMCHDVDEGLAVLVETSEPQFLGWKLLVGREEA